MLRNYCRNHMLTFPKHGNIHAKTHCNISGLDLNSKGVSLFNENLVNHSNPQQQQITKLMVLPQHGFCVKSILRTYSLTILVLTLSLKLKFLEPLIRNHFDTFMVSETKLNSSFPVSEFTIPGYRLFFKDRNLHGGGLIFYVNQGIPCKTINIFSFPNSLKDRNL